MRYLLKLFFLVIPILFVLQFSLKYFSNIEIESKPGYDWFEIQRAYPFDEIPTEERLKSIEYARNNFVSDNINSQWTLSGPTNIEGRITTIAINPVNPQIVYIGTADGGAWKSTNFCQSWTSIFDNQNTSSIGSIAIDPVNPEIVYCGTGEPNSLRSHYPGTGIYKSTNGGNSWIFSGLPNSFNIGNIAINPQNTQELYAAVLGACRRNNPERGLYKSTNAGLSWFLSMFVSDSAGAVDVVINPQSPNKIYAAFWERTRRENYIKYGGPNSALYYSSNSGTSWNVLNGGFPSNDATLGRISLDICSLNPDIIYAFTAYTNGNNRGLYKSTDAGQNWNYINSSVGGSSNYAWFNRICKVSPANPDVVYCGGLNMQVSVNGGASFSFMGESHVDQHAVAFAQSNSNFVIVGNDGGIDYSSNGGASWNASTTLPVTQFYAGDINYQSPADLMAGAQDNGTVRSSNGGLGNWFEENGGDGFYCLFDYTNPQRMYAESQNGSIVKSTNGGLSFTSGTSGLDLAYTNWSTPYIMDKTNPLIMYCGTYKIFKTTNGMQSWSVISPDLAKAHVASLGTVTTLDVSKSNPQVIYAGTDDANVWCTTNGGINWNLINSGLPNRWVTRVTIHPDSANICYVSLSGYKVDSSGAHIYKTTNFGLNWIPKNSNLPDAPINDILIDSRDRKILYIATDIGVMVSYNDGQYWQILGTGYPSYIPVHDLTFHEPTLKLVAWTHGRSSFSIMLPPISGIHHNGNNEISFKLYDNYPNPFNGSTVIKYSLSKQSQIKFSIYDITGRLILNLDEGKKSSGTYNHILNLQNHSSGVYILKLEVNNYSSTKKLVLIR